MIGALTRLRRVERVAERTNDRLRKGDKVPVAAADPAKGFSRRASMSTLSRAFVVGHYKHMSAMAYLGSVSVHK